MTAKNIFTTLNERINSQPGGRITVVFMSEFGTTEYLHYTAESCELAPYAQYENGIVITGKKRRARTLTRWPLHQGKTFAIFSGWHVPTKEMPNSWTCFDKSLFYSIVDSIPSACKLGEWSERMKPQNTAAPIYKVCRVASEEHPDSVEQYQTIEELTAVYTQTGTLSDTVRRRELQDQPYIKGLCGPIYDGTDIGGRPVIRYETQELYDILSA